MATILTRLFTANPKQVLSNCCVIIPIIMGCQVAKKALWQPNHNKSLKSCEYFKLLIWIFTSNLSYCTTYQLQFIDLRLGTT